MGTVAPEIAQGELLVESQRLRVQFGKVTAVRDLSLSVCGGQLVGLIGPNGAGKTTLLRALAGLQIPTCGHVRLMGQRLDPNRPDVMRYVGFTADTPVAYEELSVRDYLHFVAKGYNLDGIEAIERIGFWLEQVWLSEKATQKVKALSRGMRQRLGIARTLLPNPAVVLLDEPAAGLDPGGRVQFRQLLCSLREQGKALIVSSHILSDMAEYCTHIAMMAGGSIFRFGTVAQVAAASNDGARCGYTVVLARPVASAGRDLSAIDGIRQVHVDGCRITLEYSVHAEDAARLLGQLVGLGLPVSSFAANSADLEEAYLKAGIGQVD